MSDTHVTRARESSRRLADLLHRERGAMTDFLHRELGLSRGSAHYRKVAAQLVQRFPEVVEPLREGKLCITVVLELARVITPENSAQVLPAAPLPPVEAGGEGDRGGDLSGDRDSEAGGGDGGVADHPRSTG